MTEVAIQTGFTCDLTSFWAKLPGDGAWAVRVHYKAAFVIWIWMGGLITLMALGGFWRCYR